MERPARIVWKSFLRAKGDSEELQDLLLNWQTTRLTSSYHIFIAFPPLPKVYDRTCTLANIWGVVQGLVFFCRTRNNHHLPRTGRYISNENYLYRSCLLGAGPLLRELALQMLCKLPHIKAFMLGGRDAHQNGMPARKHWATNLVATTHTHTRIHTKLLTTMRTQTE